jgi:DNA-binding response OmpR family regulator
LIPYPSARPTQRYRDSHLTVDFQTETVELDGKPLKMPRKEYDLLSCLLRHIGDLITRETLLTKVWGYGDGVRTRTLDVHIRRLRKDLEPYGKMYIETVFGVGYRFQPGPAAPPAEAAGLGSTIALGAHSRSGAWRFGYHPAQ